MAVRKRTSDGGADVTGQNPQEPSSSSSTPYSTSAQPFVVDKKKKKKKKYTRGTEYTQEVADSLVRGLHRLTRAVEQGVGTWRKERNRTARKKRDGAIKDAIRNYGKATSRFARTAARIPEDVTDAWPKLRRIFK
jgi:hypothetical protein